MSFILSRATGALSRATGAVSVWGKAAALLLVLTLGGASAHAACEVAVVGLIASGQPSPVRYGPSFTLQVKGTAKYTGGNVGPGSCNQQAGSVAPNADVEIDDQGGSENLFTQGKVKADASGNFILTRTVSANTDAGVYQIYADPSPGSKTTTNFEILKADQVITFTNPGNQTFVLNATMQLEAQGGSSGKPVKFASGTKSVCTVSGQNGATLKMLAPGTCSITASQEGNSNYNAAADVTQSFNIGKLAQIITFTNPGAKTFTPGGTVPLSATGGASGNPVTFASTTASVCTVSG
ncbi:MAG TPA: hypothetical protein VHI72_15325, partial [Hyphomicrobiaceae bacterium]|nr:hypothetical protein [Hyphomicrobiaceae bacterium]